MAHRWFGRRQDCRGPARGSTFRGRRSMRKPLVAGLALGTSLTLAGAASAQDITIGVAGPMTGQYASFGTQLKNGAELAVADINAAGGVTSKQLKMEIGDDACDPKQARAVGEKFAAM